MVFKKLCAVFLLGLMACKSPSVINISPKIKNQSTHKVAGYRFSDEIDFDTAKDLIKAIKDAEDAGNEYLVLEINTPGGVVSAGQVMSRAIELSKMKIICVVDTEAYSMGSWLLQSCDVRLMTFRSVIMSHTVSVMIRDNDKALADAQAAIKAINEAMLWQLSHRTKLSVEQVRAKVDGKEWWISWKEALEDGIVDGVVEDSRLVILSLELTGKLPKFVYPQDSNSSQAPIDNP